MKHKSLFISLMLFVAAAISFGHSRAKSEGRPPENKKIDVVLYFAADVPIEHAIGYEKALAREVVSPALRERGYDVGEIVSVSESATQNGTPWRSLINHFAKDGQKDESRLLFITIATQLTAENEIVSSVVALDGYLKDIQRAQRLSEVPFTQIYWSYEDRPQQLPIANTLAGFPERLRQAVQTYDRQYKEKAKTGKYPNLLTPSSN